MFDWNLALIDVATAWVVVTLPRFVQAKLLARAGLLGPGEEDRLRPDPVQHTSFLGTLVVPALTSLAGVPVIAWGKSISHSAFRRSRTWAYGLVLATAATYALQAVGFALFMALLAKVYLAGAPVAARAGQLCLRLALISLVSVPIMDAGIAWRFLLPQGQHHRVAYWGLSAVILAALWFGGGLALIDAITLHGFFEIAQILQ